MLHLIAVSNKSISDLIIFLLKVDSIHTIYFVANLITTELGAISP